MALKFNGFFESPLFRIIIGPLMVASIGGLVVLYGSVKAIETRMHVATIRRDEQFQEIRKTLDRIETCMDSHMQNYTIHTPKDDIFRYQGKEKYNPR